MAMQRFSTYSSPATSAIARVSADSMPSCSQSAVAPTATACRATSGVCSAGRNTSTRPTCSGTSASLR